MVELTELGWLTLGQAVGNLSGTMVNIKWGVVALGEGDYKVKS